MARSPHTRIRQLLRNKDPAVRAQGRELLASLGPEAVKPVLGTLKRLKGFDLSGLDLTGIDLTGRDLRGILLRGCDLTGRDLSGFNLTGADLTDAGLSGANLTGCDLTDVILDGADLTNAKLGNVMGKVSIVGVVLRGADLRGAKLTLNEHGGADLSGADLRGAKLHGHWNPVAATPPLSLVGADLRRADIRMLWLKGADLTDADLTGAMLNSVTMEQVCIDGVKWDGATLNGSTFIDMDLRPLATVSFSKLTRLQASDCDLSGWKLPDATFGATMSGNRMVGADFRCCSSDRTTGVDFSHCDFSNADLSGADLTHAYLFGATFTEGPARRRHLRTLHRLARGLLAARGHPSPQLGTGGHWPHPDQTTAAEPVPGPNNLPTLHPHPPPSAAGEPERGGV